MAATATRNTVELYVDPFSFNQTAPGSECNYNVVGNLLFTNWQEIFATGPVAPIGTSGGIFYVEANIKAPGNVVVGVSADGVNFVGFAVFGGADNGGFVGRSINGSLETVTIPLPPAKRDIGEGTAPPANETTVRRLNADVVNGFLGGGASLVGIAPLTSPVYGSSAEPTDGSCLAPPCATLLSRFEVRIVVTARGVTGVWAWSEGFRQFYAEYPIDLRGRSLQVSVLNMRRDVPPSPPLLSGLDVRLKLENSFSRALSRIYTASEMRTTPSRFTLFNTPWPIPEPSTSVACPAVDYLQVTVPPPGFVPLMRWNLASMGLALAPTTSYNIDINLFVHNLTGIDNTVLVSVYDGSTALGVLRLAPTATGPWGSLVTGFTPIASNPALTFPTGLGTVTPATTTPAPGLLPLYSSRRIDLKLLAAYQVGSAQTGPNRNASLFAWDPEHPLLQTRKRGFAYPQAPSVRTPLQPITFAFSNALSIVLWQQTAATSGITGAAVVVDEALVGCDGIDHGGNSGGAVPAWDACGVCGGTNACIPCACTPPAVCDCCGVCGGDNSTCCCDYNMVRDACWDWLLLSAAASDVRDHFAQLRGVLDDQCAIMDRGVLGASMCCSASHWNTSAVPGIQARACANREWGINCLAPFLDQVAAYRRALPA